MKVIIFLILSYLLGAIPTGFILTNWIKKTDVRKHGSGNIGATNVARVLGIKYGIVIALMDILKGFLAVGLIQISFNNPTAYLPFLAGLLAILGHDYSIFLKFSGGKGVATTVGVILKLLPEVILVAGLVWFILVIVTKYVSLGSILGAISLPVFTYIFGKDIYPILFTSMAALLIIYSHRGNIKRLLKGKENKLNLS
ncbi:MAG: glycerol-3-phosphate 1-O-acyltransferase PlsY [bacterium]